MLRQNPTCAPCNSSPHKPGMTLLLRPFQLKANAETLENKNSPTGWKNTAKADQLPVISLKSKNLEDVRIVFLPASRNRHSGEQVALAELQKALNLPSIYCKAITFPWFCFREGKAPAGPTELCCMRGTAAGSNGTRSNRYKKTKLGGNKTKGEKAKRPKGGHGQRIRKWTTVKS